jgi:branched-chain amino acid transport system permease protein
MAGALFGYLQQYISPNEFTFQVSISIIAASVIGGSISVYGSILGAALVVLLPYSSASFSKYSEIVYGSLLVIIGLFFSGGLANLGKSLLSRLVPSLKTTVMEVHFDKAESDLVAAPSRAPVQVREIETSETSGGDPARAGLVLSALSKHYGGVAALSNVSMRVAPGRVTGLIGSNGSGKTTLLNVISGYATPERGTVILDGRDITSAPPNQVARLGVGRTFQTPAMPDLLEVWEAVAIARAARSPTSLMSTALRTKKHRATARGDWAEAHSQLALMDMTGISGELASGQPLGRRRLVEVARSLCGSPRVVLLDEPASGLDAANLRELAGALVALREAGVAVLLVEHNVPFIRSVADYLYVLERGDLIAEGPPEQVLADPRVISSYLGEPIDSQPSRPPSGVA